MMKRIFTIALLSVMFSALNLACKKDESNSNRKAEVSNANASPTQVAKDDGDQLLNDLKDTVHQYNVASIRGDKATLQRLVADDFSHQFGDKTYNKTDWIGDAPGVAGATAHEVLNEEVLAHTQYTATLGYDDKTTYNDGRPPAIFRTKAMLVKRDGRWQVQSFEK